MVSLLIRTPTYKMSRTCIEVVMKFSMLCYLWLIYRVAKIHTINYKFSSLNQIRRSYNFFVFTYLNAELFHAYVFMSNRYWLFRSWGRVGTTIGGTKVEPLPKQQAINQFKLLFEEKTANMWENRDHFVKVPNKMIMMQMCYEDVCWIWLNFCFAVLSFYAHWKKFVFRRVLWIKLTKTFPQNLQSQCRIWFHSFSMWLPWKVLWWRWRWEFLDLIYTLCWF